MGRPPATWRASSTAGSTQGAESNDKSSVGEPTVAEPDDHAIGRSRGGLTTKTHALTDGAGRLLAVLVTAGNINDTTMFAPLMAALCVARVGPGRPRTRPDYLLADKGYIYTDRPIYKPGQTVYFKAIVRDDEDALLSVPPEGTAVTLRIRDGRDNVVQTFELTTNYFGTINGQFDSEPVHLAAGG